jgi:hypothetical protein
MKFFAKTTATILILTILFPQAAFAVTASSGFKVFGGQATGVAGSESSSGYGLNVGGNPAGSSSSSSGYTVRQGGSVSGQGNLQVAAENAAAAAAAAAAQQASGGGTLLTSVTSNTARASDISMIHVGPRMATILFETDRNAISYIQYGENNLYNLQTPTEEDYEKEHEITLKNLSPGTRYNFTIHLKTVRSKISETRSYSFTTLPDIKSAPNVSGFTATAKSNSIQLNWQNPDKFRELILIRDTNYYPSSPTDGQEIYRGTGNSFTDTNVNSGQTYYYTIFIYDQDDRQSSGAISSAIIKIPEEISEEAEELKQEIDDLVEEIKKDPQEDQQEIEEEQKELEEKIEEVLEDIEQYDEAELQDLLKKIIDRAQETTEETQEKMQKAEENFQTLMDHLRDLKDEIEEKQERAAELEERFREADKIPAEADKIPEELSKIEPTIKDKTDLINMFSLVQQNISEGYQQLKEILSDVTNSQKEDLKELGEDIIDAFGNIKIERNFFETLTPERREKIEEIIERPLPQEFSPESVAVITPLDSEPDDSDEDYDWHIFAGSDAMLSIPAEIFEKDVEIITVTLKKEAYVMQYNPENDHYEAVLSSPAEKGKYQMLVQVIYGDNTYEEINKTVLVDPYGYVYTLEYEFPFTWKQEKVIGAEVILYVKGKTGDWGIWPAHLYNQINPQITTKNGEFTFLVPAGEYYLEAEAQNYSKYRSANFEVKDKVININIKLIKEGKSGLLLIIILIIIAVVPSTVALKRKLKP